jgi:hypothetical protein
MANCRRSTNTHFGNSFCLREINSRVSKGIGLPCCPRKNRQSEKVWGSRSAQNLTKGIVTKKITIKVITIKVITIKVIVFIRR